MEVFWPLYWQLFLVWLPEELHPRGKADEIVANRISHSTKAGNSLYTSES